MIKTQHPFFDENGIEHPEFIKHYTDDPDKILLQVETGYLYDEAIDLFPCQFTYQEVDKPVEEEEESEENPETEEEAS